MKSPPILRILVVATKEWEKVGSELVVLLQLNRNRIGRNEHLRVEVGRVLRYSKVSQMLNISLVK